MKTPQTATALGLLALLSSIFAIAIQIEPLRGIVGRTLGQSPISEAGDRPSVAKVVKETPPEGAKAEPKKGEKSAAELLEEQRQRIAQLERQLAQVERVLRASGLDAATPQLASNAGGDSPVLAQMGEQYATRARFEDKRKKAAERSKELRERDAKTFGAERYQAIQELAAKARPQRGSSTPEQKAAREAALSSLMNDYPEAWSTSVAVAEQALDSAINRDAQGVESYYRALLETSPYAEVVTEQGIDAIPTLQSYLARQYVSEGRLEEASAIIDSLGAQSDGVILEPNDMGEPTARSVQDIVTELRAKITQ
jgi:hypothetical protein